MSADDFVAQLVALGFQVSRVSTDQVTFPYCVPVGRFRGTEVTLGFNIPQDFPLTCPGGPCVSPRLLQLNQDASLGHPAGGVHEAPQFGADWQYWSRPHPGWSSSSRTA